MRVTVHTQLEVLLRVSSRVGGHTRVPAAIFQQRPSNVQDPTRGLNLTGNRKHGTVFNFTLGLENTR